MKKFNEDQLAFDFDAPQVRKSDPETSKKAIYGMKFGQKRLDVLHALETFKNGAATYEVAALMNVSRDSVSPHFKPLQQHDWIIATGKVKRNPATKKDCLIYALTTKYYMSKLVAGSKNKFLQPYRHICQCKTCGRTI